MNAEVKPGYRKTEMGVIPNEWQVKSLSEVSDKIMVGIASSATHAYRSEGVPLLRNQNIKPGYLDDADVLYVARSYEEGFKNKRLLANDILIARTGYPGTACVVPEKFSAAQSFTTLIARPTNSKVDSFYLCYYINSEFGQAFFEQTQIGGAQKNVNAASLQKMPVPLPTLGEQKKIASALSTVDDLISILDQLIAKKRDIQQAAMQQLLTGQRRLPGFSGEWDVKRLGNHLSFLRHGTNSRAELSTEGDVHYLHYGDIHGSQHLLLNPAKTSMPYLPRDKAKRLDRLDSGDLVFADASEDLDGIGKSVEVQLPEDMELVSGLHTIAVRFDKKVMTDGFKAYLQFIPTFRLHLRQLAAGTKVYATNRAHIASAELKIPGIEEQTAIATILSDMDSELATLEARRDKARLLKQGMMQELLTGRIRLV